jgi:hypothetical protein
MKKIIPLLLFLSFGPGVVQAQTLPAKIKTYLNKSYKGWKLAPASSSCSDEYRKSFVAGDFDGDRKTDYVVKFTVRRKGYMVAFLERRSGYRNYTLFSMKASGIRETALGIFAKGRKWSTGDFDDRNAETITLENDAVFEGPCESDDTGIYVYKNGRFRFM